MNIFYAPPTQIHGNLIELTGQEAIHASKALRYEQGDEIIIVDGQGTYYKGEVGHIAKDFVRAGNVHVTDHQSQPEVRLAAGIIKKQDRLEFLVEKAVELGVRGIAFFRGEHSVKQNVRLDRLNSVAVSAMKQSLQAWLPEIYLFDNLRTVMAHYSKCKFIAARQSAEEYLSTEQTSSGNILMLIGPEGGFSAEEYSLLQDRQTDFVLLSQNRLRTETAAISMLAQFLFRLSC